MGMPHHKRVFGVRCLWLQDMVWCLPNLLPAHSRDDLSVILDCKDGPLNPCLPMPRIPFPVHAGRCAACGPGCSAAREVGTPPPAPLCPFFHLPKPCIPQRQCDDYELPRSARAESSRLDDLDWFCSCTGRCGMGVPARPGSRARGKPLTSG